MPDLIGLLRDFLGNPAVYLFLVFVYAILVAIILPIPIEIALVWPLYEHNLLLFIAVILVMGLGKAIGAVAVLFLGLKVEKTVYYWSRKFKWFGKVVHYLDLFVQKTGYIGLFIILSIPLMTDTVPIYIYSIFHGEGKEPSKSYFGIANFLAGLTRGIIIAAVVILFGLELI